MGRREGLGKEKQGIKGYIRVKNKQDTAGVGTEKQNVWAFDTTQFDNILKKLKVQGADVVKDKDMCLIAEFLSLPFHFCVILEFIVYMVVADEEDDEAKTDTISEVSAKKEDAVAKATRPQGRMIDTREGRGARVFKDILLRILKGFL